MLYDDSEAVCELYNHWQPTFSRQPIDVVAAELLLREACVVSCPPPWMPLQSSLNKRLGSVSHTSPGLDGLPYQAYLSCRSWAEDVLWLVIELFHSGAVIPDSMRESLFAFLPKEAPSEVEGLLCLPAKAMRPLSLGNTDSKLMLSYLVVWLRQFAEMMVSGMQQCLAGREMMSNIFLL